MSQQVRLKMITLRKSQWGEANVIIHGLSSLGQKCTFLARGALKSKKRFAGGVLDPLQYIEVLGSQSPGKSNLANLDEAQLIEGFEGLRKDFDRLESAFWAADLINKIVVEDDPHNKEMFDLIGNGLKALAAGAAPEPFRIQFGLKVLQSQGVLEIESWMGPFLQSHLSAGAAVSQAECDARLPWIEHQIRLYRERAEL